MVKIEFKNAVAIDDGYGLKVNGKSLENIISTALGTRIENIGGYNSGLPDFKSNACNITVIIDPQPQEETIEDDNVIWKSVKEMEEDKIDEHTKNAPEADPEE